MEIKTAISPNMDSRSTKLIYAAKSAPKSIRFRTGF